MMTLTTFDFLVIFLLMLAAIGAFMLLREVPDVCRKVAERHRQKGEQKQADDEKRWELLRPLFLSGQITEIEIFLRFRKHSEGRWLMFKGPGFYGGWQDRYYARKTEDTAEIDATVQEAIRSDNLRERRRIAMLIHNRVQLDESIAIIYESAVKNWAFVKTAPVNNVVKLRNWK